MKHRRVFVTLEVETDAPVKMLRQAHVWRFAWDLMGRYELSCLQAQANVAKPAPKKKRAR